ncbi:type II toxin-antitoxin system YoeB family toxin [Streptomyces sp. TRM68367]|nr:type II toxin-antitoxin system YoeB family toxin [Streptomyces sp. TRM68367]
MRLVFEDQGCEDYTSWLKSDRRMLARITKLMEDVRRDPFTGARTAASPTPNARAGRIRGQGRKGALAALRDAAVLKTVYAYGTRRTESSKVDLVDLRRNHKAPQYGKYGSVMVRFGKSSKGAPPKRRTVLLIPEMDWVTDTLNHSADEHGHPRGALRHPAVHRPGTAMPSPSSPA